MHPSSAAVDPIGHGGTEFLELLAGTVVVTVGDTRHMVRAGEDTMILPVNVPHAVNLADSGRTATVRWTLTAAGERSHIHPTQGGGPSLDASHRADVRAIVQNAAAWIDHDQRRIRRDAVPWIQLIAHGDASDE